LTDRQALLKGQWTEGALDRRADAVAALLRHELPRAHGALVLAGVSAAAWAMGWMRHCFLTCMELEQAGLVTALSLILGPELQVRLSGTALKPMTDFPCKS
jgi:hypothetical protein